MYQGNVLGCTTTICGAAALPNTGGNELLMVASILTTIIGLTIVVSTAVRHAAKKGLSA